MIQVIKCQHLLPTGGSRQHLIPPSVYLYAMRYKQGFAGPRSEVPTLPDVYAALIEEGFRLLKAGEIDPMFGEGKSDGVETRIRFKKSDFASALEGLKGEIHGGKYLVWGDNRKVSLVSIAVTLMEEAVKFHS